MANTDIVVAAGTPAPSPVNWGAIVAGALVATVATLVLLLVGSGLGLTMVSPWSSQGSSATTVLASAAIWLVVVQWISSCLGGYLAGRLRRRWTSVHSDEVIFRDSAHGLLAWALATLLVVGVLGSAISSLVGSGLQATANVAAGAANAASSAAAEATTNPSMGYFVDSLFRPTDGARLNAPGQAGDGEAAAQATRILVTSVASGEISEGDKSYLAMLVAARTGLSQQDAQKRIDDTWIKIEDAKAKAQQAAETARKSAVKTTLLGALSLVVGAFIATVSAILGGKLRDEDEDAWSLSAP